MLAALVDDVVLAEDDCVLRDGELCVVRGNEPALDAELAVDGNIAAQGDGHALGDAGAVVVANVGLTVPDDGGQLIQIGEARDLVALAVQHGDDLGIRAEDTGRCC